MNELLLAIHITLPVTGIMLLALRAEKKRIETERRKLAQTLLVSLRGRRR
jgi:hypothetical protein